MVYDHDRNKEAMLMATLLIRPTKFCCKKSTSGRLKFSMAIEILSLSMRPIVSHFHALLMMLSGLVLCNMFFFLFITRWKQIRYNTPSTLNRQQLLVRNGTTPLQVICVSELFSLALYSRDLRTEFCKSSF